MPEKVLISARTKQFSLHGYSTQMKYLSLEVDRKSEIQYLIYHIRKKGKTWILLNWGLGQEYSRDVTAQIFMSVRKYLTSQHKQNTKLCSLLTVSAISANQLDCRKKLQAKQVS